MRVAGVAQVAALVSTLAAAAAVGGHLTAEGVGWGALSGLGSGVGSLALYRGLGRGQMSVVGPLSGVGAALIPALAGLALGERPSAVTLVGVAVVLPAVYLIARGDASTGEKSPASSGGSPPRSRPAAAGRLSGRRRSGGPSGALDGVLAGVGFGAFFLALSRAGPGDGLWPSAAGTAAATVLILGFVLVRRRPPVAASAEEPSAMTGTARLTALAAGVSAGAASALYLLATRQGLLVVVAVLAALYPAVTVLLARSVLRERSSRGQVAGLVMAAAAVVAITAG